MHFGMVRWFDRERGYGFIGQPAQRDIYVHYSDIVAPQGAYRALQEGEAVIFEVEHWTKGVKAVKVRPLKTYLQEEYSQP